MLYALSALVPKDLFGIIVTIVLLTISYYVFNVLRWYRRILVIGKEIDKLPGDKQHWLYGTMAEVSYGFTCLL